MDNEFPDCAACGFVNYYSKECQKADWKRHKQQDCKQVNDSEKRKERRLDKRLDRFMRLYGPLLRSAIIDRYAILAKDENVDGETICNTHTVSIDLTDLPANTATRPYLHWSNVGTNKQADLHRDAKSMISHANNMEKGSCTFLFNICHVGYDGRSVCYGYPVNDDFNYLIRHCTRDELKTSMDCKINTINAIAGGLHPVLKELSRRQSNPRRRKIILLPLPTDGWNQLRNKVKQSIHLHTLER